MAILSPGGDVRQVSSSWWAAWGPVGLWVLLIFGLSSDSFSATSTSGMLDPLLRWLLPGLSDAMGMHLFTRDDPDGWSEVGFDWVATNTMLERIEFSRTLAKNDDSDFTWNRRDFFASQDLASAEEIVDYFNDLLFQRTLPEANRLQLIEYADTDDNNNPRPLNPSRSDYDRRVEELIGLMLSLPQWHFQ